MKKITKSILNLKVWTELEIIKTEPWKYEKAFGTVKTEAVYQIVINENLV